MIIKRIAEGIKTQDWFVVTIEVMIVVVGIFIGLQVDDWNEARKDRLKENDYLVRLSEDIKTSIFATQNNVDFQISFAKRAEVILGALRVCEIKPKEQVDFANGLYHLGKISPVQLARNTLDELKSSGKFSIIQNQNLRQKLSKTILSYDDHRSFILDVQGRLAPQINYVDGLVAIRVNGPIGGASKIKWEDVEMDFKALCKDQRFYNAVSASTNYVWDVISGGISEIEKYKDLESLLKSELEKSQ